MAMLPKASEVHGLKINPNCANGTNGFLGNLSYRRIQVKRRKRRDASSKRTSKSLPETS